MLGECIPPFGGVPHAKSRTNFRFESARGQKLTPSVRFRCGQLRLVILTCTLVGLNQALTLAVLFIWGRSPVNVLQLDPGFISKFLNGFSKTEMINFLNKTE